MITQCPVPHNFSQALACAVVTAWNEEDRLDGTPIQFNQFVCHPHGKDDGEPAFYCSGSFVHATYTYTYHGNGKTKTYRCWFIVEADGTVVSHSEIR